MKKLNSVCLILLATWMAAAISSEPAVDAPAILTQWKGWIEQSNPNRSCLGVEYENCLWFGSLNFELTGKQSYSGTVAVENLSKSAQRVGLPSGEGVWPYDAKAGGAVVALGRDESGAFVFVPSGFKGAVSFTLDMSRSASTALSLPSGYGLVAVKGKNGKIKYFDANQPLSLVDENTSVASNDLATAAVNAAQRVGSGTINVKISRLIQDAQVPLMTTMVKIENGSSKKLVKINGLISKGSIPVQLNAPSGTLSEGTFSFEAPAGISVISLVTREPVDWAIEWSSPIGDGAQIDPVEFIFVKSDERLRKVVANGRAIDPRSIDAQLNFGDFPAYQLSKQDKISFTLKPVEHSSSESAAAVQTEAWLDFDGESTFANQRLVFQKSNQGWFEPSGSWRAVSAQTHGVPAVIANSESGKAGRVALSSGLQEMSIAMKGNGGWVVDLPAVATVGITANTSVARLHIPLGWRVLGVFGAGEESTGWWSSMSLWDWFLVIITCWGLRSMFGGRASFVGCSALLLGRFFIGAPFVEYLPLLGFLALAKYLPIGRLKTLATGATAVGLAFLLVGLAPFTLSRIQKVIHTSLEDGQQPQGVMHPRFREDMADARNESGDASRSPIIGGMAPGGPEAAVALSAVPAPMVAAEMQRSMDLMKKSAAPMAEPVDALLKDSMSSANEFLSQSPKGVQVARVNNDGAQAGDGFPAWNTGETVEIVFSGPTSNQTIAKVYLVKPWLIKMASLLEILCSWGIVFLMGRQWRLTRQEIKLAKSNAQTNVSLGDGK